jgi:hypothetical protein
MKVNEMNGRITAMAGRSSSRSMAFVRLGLFATAIVVLAAGCSTDKGSFAQSFVDRLVARDSSAGAMLTQEGALIGLASAVGIAGLPASVTVTASDVVTIKAQGSTGPTVVTAMLEAKQGDQTLGRESASFSLVVVDTSVGLRIDGGSSFASGGFGAVSFLDSQAPGASKAEADAAYDDYAKGNAWLPGVDVAPRAMSEPVTLDPVIRTDPTRLSSYRTVASPGVAGERTTWYVDVGTGLYQVQPHLVASAMTTQPVAEQVIVGSLEPTTLKDSAHETAIAFRDAIVDGDTQTAIDLFLDAGSVRITDAGWALMQRPDWTPKVETDSWDVQLVGEALPFRALDGDLALVQTADGSWRIEPAASSLVTDVVGGHGSYQYVNDTPFPLGLGGDTVEVTLNNMVFRHTAAGDEAVANFSLHSLADRCSGLCIMYATDSFRTVYASWAGKAFGSPLPADQLIGETFLGIDMKGTVRIEGRTSADVPIQILVTAFGNVDVGDGWLFSTD